VFAVSVYEVLCKHSVCQSSLLWYSKLCTSVPLTKLYLSVATALKFGYTRNIIPEREKKYQSIIVSPLSRALYLW